MATSVEASPSLEDIIACHGLKKDRLSREECPVEVRHEIAMKLEDWKMAGYYFGFPPEKLKAIDRDNETEELRRVALLDAWARREGESASCFKLMDVLYRRGRRDLVDLLCDMIKSEVMEVVGVRPINVCCGGQIHSYGSENEVLKRITSLERQFDSLHEQLKSELSEAHVSVDKLLQSLTMLPIAFRREYEQSIQSMLPNLEMRKTIHELFLRLNPLFTFIDFGLLDHLVTKFGSRELKGAMNMYVDEVQEFMRETTVGEIMDHWPGDEKPHVDYSELRMKFKDSPKTYTLERLNNFRRKFCSRVRLSEFIFGLISLEPAESFFVTWLVPTVVVPELKSATSRIDHHFYELEHVLSISLGQEQLHPLSVSITPIIPVSVSQNQKQQPIPTVVSSVVQQTKDMHLKTSTSDSVNIVTIGWEGASRFANEIIGSWNRDNNLKLWDFSCEIHDVPSSVARAELRSEIMKELRTRAQECQSADMVLYFEHPISLSGGVRGTHLTVNLGFTVADLTGLFGRSIWNNAVIVQPFRKVPRQPAHTDQYVKYKSFLKGSSTTCYEFKKCDIDVSSIPCVPINIDFNRPDLPDRIDWLSPLWDKCLLQMKETAQNAFLTANTSRIKLSTTGQKREDSDKRIGEQAIFYVPGSDTSNAPIRSSISTLLGTQVAGPLGHAPHLLDY